MFRYMARYEKPILFNKLTVLLLGGWFVVVAIVFMQADTSVAGLNLAGLDQQPPMLEQSFSSSAK